MARGKNHGLGIAAHRDALCVRQIGVQPDPALRERLLVRIDPLDGHRALLGGHQVVANTQFDLAADRER